MIVAGIMTGTSVDAVDIAICDIEQKSDCHAITLLLFYSKPFPKELSDDINRSIGGNASIRQLSDLPYQLASFIAEVFQEAQLSQPVGRIVEVIGAHGQTLFHNPPHSTWQALSGSALAVLTETTVIHDFRAADIALGGQGAPLVPMFDVAVLCSDTKHRIALNIGGIANITLLPKNLHGNTIPNPGANVVAFDVGPGNVLIDAATQLFFGKEYDTDGKIARAGAVIQPLLNEFKNHPYFSMDPPKSTGREVFNRELVEHAAERFRVSLRPWEDIVTTVTELTAWCIADHIERYKPDTEEIIVSGGGSKNLFLLERLHSYLANASIKTSDELGIPSQAKEAMAFAYIAWRTIHNLPGNFPSATGAARPVILGSISKQI